MEFLGNKISIVVPEDAGDLSILSIVIFLSLA